MTNSNENNNADDGLGWPPEVEVEVENEDEVEIKRECTADDRCGRLTCEVCSAPQRLRWIRQTLAITKAHPGQCQIATIVTSLPTSSFFDLRYDIRGVFRDILRRAEFEGARFRGGVDVFWDSSLNVVDLCVHVLAINVPPKAWASIPRRPRKWEMFDSDSNLDFLLKRDSNVDFLLKVERLRDPERQIADLVRFPARFWPNSATAVARADTFPADHLAEVADLASSLTLNECVFEFGRRTAPKSAVGP